MQEPYLKTVIYDDFYEMLNGLYENHSDKIAVKYFKKDEIINITYKELVNHVCSIYNYYKIHNIKNKHIGIVSENRYEYISLYLASTFFNVIVPLDKEMDINSLNKCIEKFDNEVILYTNSTKDKVIKAVKGLNLKLINIDEEYTKIVDNEFEISTFFKEIENVNKDDFCVLASTSGTDGEMKGVMLSQYNIVINVRGTLENNILKNPTLSLLPMNHTFGFNPGVLATIYNATTVCLNTNLKNLIRDLKVFNPYFFEAVPMIIEGMYNNIIREIKIRKKEKTFYNMIKVSKFLLKYGIDIRHLLFGNIINKRLRLVVSGGAELNSDYVGKFDEIGIKILNGYGLTECSPTIAVSRECNNVVGSSGTIMNHIDVKIAEDGEILVKGPNLMLGYYKNEKATANSMVDGYFKTGDLGYVEDRVIFVTGRKKNLIILKNGKNFSPEAVEKELLKLPYIKECLVMSKKKNTIEIIVAKILLNENSEKIKSDIDKINNSLPSYMRIDEYEIVSNEFEKTSSKKIIRSKYVK